MLETWEETFVWICIYRFRSLYITIDIADDPPVTSQTLIFVVHAYPCRYSSWFIVFLFN